LPSSSSSSSANELSPGMSSLICVFQTLEKEGLLLVFLFLIADRLANIEDALNNLIMYINTLGEDVASIAVQLKPLSKNIKIIQNVTIDEVYTSSYAISMKKMFCIS
jgi:hypothetical protein